MKGAIMPGKIFPHPGREGADFPIVQQQGLLPDILFTNMGAVDKTGFTAWHKALPQLRLEPGERIAQIINGGSKVHTDLVGGGDCLNVINFTLQDACIGSFCMDCEGGRPCRI